jgi:heavy metal translocating P-type ATPase
MIFGQGQVTMKDMAALRGIGYMPNRPALADSDGLGEVVRGQSGAFKRLAAVSITTLAIVGITLHLLLRYVVHTGTLTFSVPLYAVLLGGLPLVVELMRKLAKREFGSDLLAGISIVTSVIEGEYLVGAIVVLMLSGGTTLEAYASRRASAVLKALARRMPYIAHRAQSGQVEDVAIDRIAVGDVLIIYPHEACPTDGTVIEGQGQMNESFLTGEPFEISKAPGSTVISGALNGETPLTIRTDKIPSDSRYARIMRVMEETQQRRPRLRRLGDQLGAWYTPVAVALAILAWTLTGDSQRFLAVIVMATPCPLLIAIPVAIIGAISRAARSGIIIKNPAVLEQVDACRTFIFDKTGTLTYGRPLLTEIECAPGFTRPDVLRLAASVERYSKHPLAKAILHAAQKDGLQLEPASEICEPPGKGLFAVVGGRKVLLTGRKRVAVPSLPPMRSGLECLVFVDGTFAAACHFHDAPRSESAPFVKHLKPRHHASRILLVSGDREPEVHFLAGEVGITDIRSGATPEEKVASVREEAKHRKTLFVGDGINDAPAMQAATVGVAFGVNNDITSEAADAVILDSSISKVDELIHIGRRMRSIALESAVGGITLSIAGMIFAAFGYLPPIGGAIAQEAIDLIAVLNAVRSAAPSANLRDF